MSLITVKQTGDFSRTENYFKKLLHKDLNSLLHRYGKLGVDALRSATPKDTGLAASSWDYVIEQNGNGYSLSWVNSDIENGVSVVILIDQGHATKSGGWFSGYHFIDETIDPIIKKLAKEVTSE